MPPTKATLPTLDNPVVALRGSTLQRTFAFRLGISRMALLRMEQGCLPEPSTKLKPFLPDGLSWATFVEDYRAYQEAKRIANYGVLTDDIDFSGYHHPLEEWIDQSVNQPSLTSVCVALCLHLPIMHRFLNGPYPSLPPESFLEALKQSGYSTPLITDFVLGYAEWRNG